LLRYLVEGEQVQESSSVLVVECPYHLEDQTYQAMLAGLLVRFLAFLFC
jgi:hypothetical protein